VWPVAAYGCESWTLRKNEETRLDAFEMKGLGNILRVSWTAKKTNEWVLNKPGVKMELLDTVTARKLAYYGHTTKKQGSCLEKEIMQGTKPGACRRGRPRTAWMDNITLPCQPHNTPQPSLPHQPPKCKFYGPLLTAPKLFVPETILWMPWRYPGNLKTIALPVPEFLADRQTKKAPCIKIKMLTYGWAAGGRTRELIACRNKSKYFPSHVAHWAAVIAVLVALSQTPAATARPRIRG